MGTTKYMMLPTNDVYNVMKSKTTINLGMWLMQIV